MRPYYHEFPGSLGIETTVLDSRPGGVLIEKNPFFPGGGGQLADSGILRWSGGEVKITGFEKVGSNTWIQLENDIEMHGDVEAVVDRQLRGLMSELHTGSHLLNAIVFRNFNQALVTGVQLNADGSGRMDFDLPDCDNEQLKRLSDPVNEIIRNSVVVRESYVDVGRIHIEPGLVRTKMAMPPISNEQIRVIEIANIDRQVCGGTHLAATGESRPFQILKVENKGRQNRRIRFAIVGTQAAPA
jgi:misacylated tRNA(Ala) deacylase